jgi:hypothetical protein
MIGKARRRLIAQILLLICATAATYACTAGERPDQLPVTPSSTDPSAPPDERATSPARKPTLPRAPTVTPAPRARATFDGDRAFTVVEHLAGQIGPREAASSAFHEAADYVGSQFEDLGYEVSTVPVPVPAGDSWGVPVEAGDSANVIADQQGFDPSAPHVVIGAHLDTVAAAPGAEDNASGVGVILELARMTAVEPTDVPVRFIAFGAEEPRGDGDDLHHFGSQQYVATLTETQRNAVLAMVSLDRVGVASDSVPICTGGTGTTDVQDALIAAADRAGVPASSCENRASDHWSFEKSAIAAARLGSVPYTEYHSDDDVPSVVDPERLEHAGTIVWAWLSGLEP